MTRGLVLRAPGPRLRGRMTCGNSSPVRSQARFILQDRTLSSKAVSEQLFSNDIIGLINLSRIEMERLL